MYEERLKAMPRMDVFTRRLSGTAAGATLRIESLALSRDRQIVLRNIECVNDTAAMASVQYYIRNGPYYHDIARSPTGFAHTSWRVTCKVRVPEGWMFGAYFTGLAATEIVDVFLTGEIED